MPAAPWLPAEGASELDDALARHRAGREAPGEPSREHLHAICSSCGRIIDLPGDLLDPVTTWLATAADFKLAPAHVALSGVCGTCRA